jgi:hypothetical protein
VHEEDRGCTVSLIWTQKRRPVQRQPQRIAGLDRQVRRHGQAFPGQCGVTTNDEARHPCFAQNPVGRRPENPRPEAAAAMRSDHHQVGGHLPTAFANAAVRDTESHFGRGGLDARRTPPQLVLEQDLGVADRFRRPSTAQITVARTGHDVESVQCRTGLLRDRTGLSNDDVRYRRQVCRYQYRSQASGCHSVLHSTRCSGCVPRVQPVRN